MIGQAASTILASSSARLLCQSHCTLVGFPFVTEDQRVSPGHLLYSLACHLAGRG